MGADGSWERNGRQAATSDMCLDSPSPSPVRSGARGQEPGARSRLGPGAGSGASLRLFAWGAWWPAVVLRLPELSGGDVCVGGTSAALYIHWMKPFTAETLDLENLGQETLDLETLGQDS